MMKQGNNRNQPRDGPNIEIQQDFKASTITMLKDIKENILIK